MLSAYYPKTRNLFPERRRFFRYGLDVALPVIVENTKIGEPLGMGMATEIGSGGLCIRHIELPRQARSGDNLDLLLLGTNESLLVRGRLVRHEEEVHFGVELDLSDDECSRLDKLLSATCCHS
jgi:hypothetical protein